MLASAVPSIHHITPRMMIEILVRSEVLMSSVKTRLILAYASAPPLTVVTNWTVGTEEIAQKADRMGGLAGEVVEGCAVIQTYGPKDAIMQSVTAPTALNMRRIGHKSTLAPRLR